CSFSCDDAALVAIKDGGYLEPLKNGSSSITIKAGSKSGKVPVVVKDFDKEQPVSFKNEVIASLNVGGCHARPCHATPSGKARFRRSLRGCDPDADFAQLTRDGLGPRGDRQTPDSSLILLKSLGKVPHEGAQRFRADSEPARAIRTWLAEGMKEDDATKTPAVKSLAVLPGSRVQSAPGRFQQLAVGATYTGGSTPDGAPPTRRAARVTSPACRSSRPPTPASPTSTSPASSSSRAPARWPSSSAI